MIPGGRLVAAWLAAMLLFAVTAAPTSADGGLLGGIVEAVVDEEKPPLPDERAPEPDAEGESATVDGENRNDEETRNTEARSAPTDGVVDSLAGAVEEVRSTVDDPSSPNETDAGAESRHADTPEPAREQKPSTIASAAAAVADVGSPASVADPTPPEPRERNESDSPANKPDSSPALASVTEVADPIVSPSDGAAHDVVELLTDAVRTSGSSESRVGPAVEPLTAAATPLLQDTTQSTMDVVDPVVTAVAEPLVANAVQPTGAEPVTDSVEPIVAAVVEPVAAAAEPIIASSLAPLAETVDAAVGSVVEPVVASVEPAVEPVVEPMASAIESTVLQPAIQTLDATVAPVTTAAQPVLNPVLAPDTDPLDGVVIPAVEPLREEVAPVLDTSATVVETVPSGVSETVDTLAPTSIPVLAVEPEIPPGEARSAAVSQQSEAVPSPGAAESDSVWPEASGTTTDEIAMPLRAEQPVPDQLQVPSAAGIRPEPEARFDTGTVAEAPPSGLLGLAPWEREPATLASPRNELLAMPRAGHGVPSTSVSVPDRVGLAISSNGLLSSGFGAGGAAFAALASLLMLATAFSIARRVCLDSRSPASWSIAPLPPPG